MTPPTNNAQRAARGKLAIIARDRLDSEDDPTVGLIDLLADVRHGARALGLDFPRAVEISEAHFAVEVLAEGFPEEGQRVKLARDVDRFPHFIARAGSLGTVAEVQRHHVEGGGLQSVSVKLDDPPAGSGEWDGELIWTDDDPDLDEVLVADLIPVAEGGRR